MKWYNHIAAHDSRPLHYTTTIIGICQAVFLFSFARRNEEERETGIHLSDELTRVRAQSTETISNQKRLSTRINEIESSIRIVNAFLEDAGVMIDLKETEGYRLLLRQIQDTESEYNRLNSRIDSIQTELNTISQHKQELEEARNTRNRRS